MNCEEVQAQLLEYLDKSLDRISTKHLEIHLSSCPPCRAEADSLDDCVRQVAALPIVDPPLGFAQRVMAHAREIDLSPSIRQRLALFMQNQIPLQAAAVVLIAIFSAFLYQKMDSKSPAPATRIAVLTDAAEKAKSVPQPESTSSTPSKPVKQSRPTTAQKNTAPAVAPESADAPSQPARTTDAESGSEGRLETPKRAPISVQEVAAGRENSRLIGDNFTFGALPLGRSRQSSFRSAPMALNEPMFSINEPSADVEFVVRRRPAQRRDSAETDNLESTRKSAEAEASPATAALRRAAPSPFLSGMIVETRWFTVAPEHFEQFKKDLAAQTLVESETPTAKQEKEFSQKSDRPLAVKVVILPAIER
jgi:hypothetical protein